MDSRKSAAGESFRIATTITASPNRIYSILLDERLLSALTHMRTTMQPWAGGRYSWWNGYAAGHFTHVETGKRITMTWRTWEFPERASNSEVDLTLEPVAGGTRITINHANIPRGYPDRLKQVWRTNLLEPLKSFLSVTGLEIRPSEMPAATVSIMTRPTLPMISRPKATTSRPAGATKIIRKTRKAKGTLSKKTPLKKLRRASRTARRN